MQMLLIIVLSILIAGCTTTFPPARVIRESPELLVRLDHDKNCEAGNGEKPLSHPVRFTGNQVRRLLAALSAREKVGLLSSFSGTSNTPRLFDHRDLDLLVPHIEDAFATATPKEVVVFLLVTPVNESLNLITSGTLAIRDNTLSVALHNFRHPVRTTLSEVGASDRLGDVRETLRYVRRFPCASVGEQDFAVFFDVPHFQTEARSGSLIRYPERTLSIAYPDFLATHSDATGGEREGLSSHPKPVSDRTETQAISDLKRRIAELERTNQALIDRMPISASAEGSSKTLKPATDNAPPVATDAQARLMDIIRRLETRVSELERRIGQDSAR